MSKYLCVGIAKEVVAEVRDKEMVKKIKRDFFNKVEKNLYNVKSSASKDSDKIYITFKLKDEILTEYGIDLIIEQYQKYIKSSDSDKAIKYYKNVKSKSKEEILNLIYNENSPYLYTFTFGKYGFDIGYLFEERVDAYITEFVTFHCSEKTYMEEYYDFFNYIRNILINSTDNPLRTALAISL